MAGNAGRTVAEGDATTAALAVIECCIGFVPFGWVGTHGTCVEDYG